MALGEPHPTRSNLRAGRSGRTRQIDIRRPPSGADHSGQFPGSLEGQPANVLLASAEDTEAEVLVPRLMAAGADLSRVRFPRLRDDGGPAALTFPADLDLLADAVEEFDVRLLILDPLVAYVGEEYDTHRDHHVRRVLAPLAELAEETEAAILPLVHINKKDARNVLERVGGSVAFVNAPRSVLALGTDPDEGESSTRRVLAHAKSNWGAKQASLSVTVETHTITGGIETSRAQLEGESRVSADELFVSRTAEEREEGRDAKEFLLQAVSDGPRDAAEIKTAAEKAGISWRTCQYHRGKLGIRSERKGFGGGSVWHPPIHATSGARGEELRERANGSNTHKSEPSQTIRATHSPLGGNGVNGGPERPRELFAEKYADDQPHRLTEAEYVERFRDRQGAA